MIYENGALYFIIKSDGLIVLAQCCILSERVFFFADGILYAVNEVKVGHKAESEV